MCVCVLSRTKERASDFRSSFFSFCIHLFLFILCIMSSAFSSTSSTHPIRMGMYVTKMLVTLVNGKFFASLCPKFNSFRILVCCAMSVVFNSSLALSLSYFARIILYMFITYISFSLFGDTSRPKYARLGVNIRIKYAKEHQFHIFVFRNEMRRCVQCSLL